jgi:acyl-CoA thioesterase
MIDGPGPDERAAADELAARGAAVMYARGRAAQTLGIEFVRARHSYAQLMMTVREDVQNGHDSCHGGIVFTPADTAFAYACNSRNDANVALQHTLSFAAPGRVGDRLVAVAEERAPGNRTGTYDVSVVGTCGAVLAFFRGTSYRLNATVV